MSREKMLQMTAEMLRATTDLRHQAALGECRTEASKAFHYEKALRAIAAGIRTGWTVSEVIAYCESTLAQPKTPHPKDTHASAL